MCQRSRQVFRTEESILSWPGIISAAHTQSIAWREGSVISQPQKPCIKDCNLDEMDCGLCCCISIISIMWFGLLGIRSFTKNSFLYWFWSSPLLSMTWNVSYFANCTPKGSTVEGEQTIRENITVIVLSFLLCCLCVAVCAAVCTTACVWQWHMRGYNCIFSSLCGVLL